ncbi:hypothetical protein [Halosimplex sp. J119]
MKDQAWRSVEVVRNNNGEPHVLQQKVTVYTAGVDEESSGYTKPEIQHRLVPLKSLVEFDD